MSGGGNKFGGCWLMDSIKSYKRGWDFKGTVRREKEQGLSPETLQRGQKEEEEPSKETEKALQGSEEESQGIYDGLEACQMESMWSWYTR